MKYRSNKAIRLDYMTNVREFPRIPSYNPDYVGCLHKEANQPSVHGFFDMFHGDKENIDGFISNFLKIAEDGQSIYEFMQNAADCHSTSQYIYYNDEYFLVINNGDVFNKTGLLSILNVAQSAKNDPAYIGRFGIGFKLVHRLVGKGDGLDELTKDYKGPIMFSWSRKADLQALMNCETPEPCEVFAENDGLPYLTKIVLTNFPAGPDESVKDLDYHNKVLFTNEEYNEMCAYVNECMGNSIDEADFNHGTLFFIKLGEGKRKLLEQDYEQNLKTGIEYSLNTLRLLKDIKVNGNHIHEVKLELNHGKVEKGSNDFISINPEYKDADINFSIGYNKIDFTNEKPFEAVEQLKSSPTFYKYFPFGDEMHSSALFVHCDSFSNEANRRKLHNDATNKALFPVIAKFITDRLDSLVDSNNLSEFQQIYANILLCEEPHGNSSWLNDSFYQHLFSHLKKTIPTEHGVCTNVNNVKIRKIKCNVPLSIVNEDYRWFLWEDKNVADLINSAKNKLNLKSYDIVDFLSDCNIELLEEWVANATDEEYLEFLKDLSNSADKIKVRPNSSHNLCKAKIFKFSDGKYHAINDTFSYIQLGMGWRVGKYNPNYPLVLKSVKNIDYCDELKSIGIYVSEINFSEYGIFKCFPIPDDKEFFNLIAAKVVDNSLTTAQKKNLFLGLTSVEPAKKLQDVGEETIKKLKLCKDSNGNSAALSSMIGRSYDVPEWLEAYQIAPSDYFSELDKYLIPMNQVYKEVVYPQWDTICASQISDIYYFYKDVQDLYNLDEVNNPSLKGKAFIYTEEKKFSKNNTVAYNQHFRGDDVNYKGLDNVIRTFFAGSIPDKRILIFMGVAPFDIDSDNLCGIKMANDTPESYVPVEDIVSFIEVCNKNKESFFDTYIVEEVERGVTMYAKRTGVCQTYTSNKELQSFIKQNLSESLVLLPCGLEDFKDQNSIIQGEDLYLNIVEQLGAEEDYRDTLISMVKYETPKLRLLQLIDEIRVDLDCDLNEEDSTGDIINLAASVISTDHANARNEFISKISITRNGQTYYYKDIATASTNDFSIEGVRGTLKLSEVLPNEYQNSSIIQEIILRYNGYKSLTTDLLEKLFKVTSTVDTDEVYEQLVENYSNGGKLHLINAQQLAFALAYHSVCENSDKSIPEIKVKAADGTFYSGDHFAEVISYIGESFTLSEEYRSLGRFISLPCKCGNATFLNAPFISEEGKFICPGIDTKDKSGNIDYGKVRECLNDLQPLYRSNKDLFKTVDWSEYEEHFGFNASECVFPSSLAQTDESLPDEIILWLEQSDANYLLLQEMGLWTERNIEIRFRRFMSASEVEFDERKFANCEDVSALENCLLWLSGKTELFPMTVERYKAFTALIERINELRTGGGIVLTDNIDIDAVDSDSIEYSSESYREWCEETGYKIYLYGCAMPHNVTIDEYIEGTVYEYLDGDITDDGRSIIYVNSEADIQATLLNHATNNTICLTKEEVYKLFNRSITDLTKKLEALKAENDLLKSGRVPQEGQIGMAGYNPKDLDADARPEYNEIARKKVRQYLEREGYRFTQGIGDYTSIPGVLDINGNPCPLVVKSCKFGKLYISPQEWGELLRPNAMLWAYDGSRVVPLHLRALIREQEKLVLTMATNNLDDDLKVSRFAQALGYFKQVNFEFDSVRPTQIANAYDSYAFDDRPMDEKLTPDDFK